MNKILFNEHLKIRKSKQKENQMGFVSKYNKNNNNKKLQNCFLSFIILIIMILELICIINLYLAINKTYIEKDIISNKENIYNIENISGIMNNITKNYTKPKFKILTVNEAVENWKRYVEICKNDSLINNKTFIKSKEPKITAIIPVYNSEETIKLAIRSIQNQKMKDIEILLVNDVSNNKTTEIIENLKKEDPRIRIINNEKNMGILYSRCIGILNARGKYLLFLDNDDMFCDNDIFDVLYDETENEFYDIISFQSFENYRNSYRGYYHTMKRNKKLKVAFQPELGITPFNISFPLYYNNALIWGKLMRTSVIQAAVNILGIKKYSIYLLWSEDTSLFFIVCTVAESYKFIEKFGIFHYASKKSTSSAIIKKNHQMFGEVYNLEILFDFSKNEYKKYCINKLMDMKTWGHFTLENENTTKYFKSVIKKFLTSDYIDEKDKNKIREGYQKYNIID